MSDYYINMKCRKCGRFSGTVRTAKEGTEKIVGCKICGNSTSINLKQNQHVVVGDIEVTTGYYIPYDC